MSYGVVMCGTCKHEVHQIGPEIMGRHTWLHCEDHSPACAGSPLMYPKNPSELLGKWCGADSCGIQPEFDVISRPKRLRRA